MYTDNFNAATGHIIGSASARHIVLEMTDLNWVATKRMAVHIGDTGECFTYAAHTVGYLNQAETTHGVSHIVGRSVREVQRMSADAKSGTEQSSVMSVR